MNAQQLIDNCEETKILREEINISFLINEVREKFNPTLTEREKQELIAGGRKHELNGN